MGFIKHRQLNHSLTVLVILVAGYILVAPMLPNIDYWRKTMQNPSVPAYVTAVTAGQTPPPNDVPKDSRLVIPKIYANAPIGVGASETILRDGLWMRPNASTPAKGGNTVIAGHRFSYNPGLTQPFYHLDKLVAGDKIVVTWNGKAYSYTVAESKVVHATQTSVEAPTKDAQLTLYTCTPLWNPKDRLVIVAKLDKEPS